MNSFQIYYIAGILECLTGKDKFIPVYASSNIKIYPFQIATTDFALHSPYQKGAVLCDESVTGKSMKLCLLLYRNGMKGKK